MDLPVSSPDPEEAQTSWEASLELRRLVPFK
jgi:hypothetical protein